MNKRTAKHVAWAYLIKHGCVFKEWEYYSGRYQPKPNVTKKCLKEMLLCGIDWNKTMEPDDTFQCEFTDTFNDAINVDVIEGTLVLQSGQKYEWGCKFDAPRNVFEIVAEFHELDDIGNIAKAKLENWNDEYL